MKGSVEETRSGQAQDWFMQGKLNRDAARDGCERVEAPEPNGSSVFHF